MGTLTVLWTGRPLKTLERIVLGHWRLQGYRLRGIRLRIDEEGPLERIIPPPRPLYPEANL